MISKEEALQIARKLASAVYKDLSVYEVKVTLLESSWYIDYWLKDPGMVGGGPHFVLSAKTGEVLSSRFEQ
jgi:hypothetical protein